MNLPHETRRALVRKYKETVLPAGVLVIRNQLNGRACLSGSLDVEGAMNRPSTAPRKSLPQINAALLALCPDDTPHA